jgi:hypothetical protein
MEFFYAIIHVRMYYGMVKVGVKVWVSQLGQARQHAPNFIMGMGRPLCDIHI